MEGGKRLGKARVEVRGCIVGQPGWAPPPTRQAQPSYFIHPPLRADSTVLFAGLLGPGSYHGPRPCPALAYRHPGGVVGQLLQCLTGPALLHRELFRTGAVGHDWYRASLGTAGFHKWGWGCWLGLRSRRTRGGCRLRLWRGWGLWLRRGCGWWLWCGCSTLRSRAR